MVSARQRPPDELREAVAQCLNPTRAHVGVLDRRRADARCLVSLRRRIDHPIESGDAYRDGSRAGDGPAGSKAAEARRTCWPRDPMQLALRPRRSPTDAPESRSATRMARQGTPADRAEWRRVSDSQRRSRSAIARLRSTSVVRSTACSRACQTAGSAPTSSFERTMGRRLRRNAAARCRPAHRSWRPAVLTTHVRSGRVGRRTGRRAHDREAEGRRFRRRSDLLSVRGPGSIRNDRRECDAR